LERVDLPPRYLVSAASYALAQSKIPPQKLAAQVVRKLNESRRPGWRLTSPNGAMAA
jgi:hypothetical protein